MNIIYFLIPIAFLLGGTFAIFFLIAVIRGQFDDVETPAYTILLNNEVPIQRKDEDRE